MKKNLFPVLIVFGLALSRLLPHPPNFTPIGAMAILGPRFLPNKTGLVLPLLALFISDFFLGFYGAEMLFVYGSFLLISLLALKFKNLFLLSLFSSLSFFLITNLGVWLTTSMYPKTIEGLVLCYFAAIPFFRNSLLGDLVYVFTLFPIVNWGWQNTQMWARQHQ